MNEEVAADHEDRSQADRSESLARESFGMVDVTLLIVGIVVGTAIFKSPTFVFQNAGGPLPAMLCWVAGGLLSFCGALCYAELATALPRNGGDYEYLNRAYRPVVGFLFGWAQWTAVLSGSLAAMAYAFGDYAVRVFLRPAEEALGWAAAAILLVAVVNILGVVVGKTAQNLLSIVKVAGLVAVALAGLGTTIANPLPVPPAAENQPLHQIDPAVGPPEVPTTPATRQLGLAMVFVLYAFGGWNDAAFVAAEVRNPRRNLPRALLGGIALITLIYLAVNWSILATLGWEAASQSNAPAADVMRLAFGPIGERLVSSLVAVSALGAIHGMMLTGARVNERLGADYRAFAWLSARSPRNHAPIGAVLTLAAAALALMVCVGTLRGQQTLDWVLASVRLRPIAWDAYFGGFETLVASTAPVFWAFFLLTGLAVVVLRLREPQLPRPFKIPFYPLPVVLFCATSAYMLYASLAYAGRLTLLGAMPVAIGLIAYVATGQSLRRKR
jgi:basic amino acid/polyamine antiporter, APA family